MRLHIGCGKRILGGFVNIDAQAQPEGMQQPEVIANALQIPLPDNCADEILAVHIFEHIHPLDCGAALDEWHRLLKPGGKLALEMPDIIKCCKNLLSCVQDEQMSLWGIYGDPSTKDDYSTHRWGWTFATIRPLLQRHGFGQAQEHPTQWHSVGKFVRDFRVTAVREDIHHAIPPHGN